MPPAPSEAETLRAYTGAFLRRSASRLSPHTHRGYNDAYRRQIDPALGRFPVASLTRRQVEDWMAAFPDARAAVRAHRVLRLILSAAVHDGLIEKNPALGLRLPPVPLPGTESSTRTKSSGS